LNADNLTLLLSLLPIEQEMGEIGGFQLVGIGSIFNDVFNTIVRRLDWQPGVWPQPISYNDEQWYNLPDS
jgi:hypothetical protein